MLVARDARRMELAGIKIPRKADGSPDCIVELSPRSVFDDADAIEFFKNNSVTIAPGDVKAFGK